jgi:hypothetical protein
MSDPTHARDTRRETRHLHNKHKWCCCGMHSSRDMRKRSKRRELDYMSGYYHPSYYLKFTDSTKRKWAVIHRYRGKAKRDKKYGTR